MDQKTTLAQSSKSWREHWFWPAIETLPLVAPAALAAFGSVAVALLLLGQLHDWLVWPLGVAAALIVGSIVFTYSRTERPGSPRERRTFDLVVIMTAVVWLLFNAVYTSQNIFTSRDPATYAVAGTWLIDNAHLQIENPEIFRGIEGLRADSAGFASDLANDSDHVYAQGLHLLPALLGLGGRIVGDAYMLHLNPVFGATALLAVYGFARLLVRPRWATLATVAFAVSLPLLYFSRDTYTEPLAATFTFGALALLWVAQQTKNLKLWFIAGLVTGAGALTRIDALLTVAGILVFMFAFLALRTRKERVVALRQSVALLTGIVPVCALGWLDISQLSPIYYVNSLPLIMQELLIIVAIALAGVAAVVIAWRTNFLSWLNRYTRSWRGPAVAILVLLLAVGLASRPLWYVGYDAVENSLVSTIQIANGQPVEPRNYAEQTVNWLVWYMGPILAVLGAGGLALAAARLVRSRDLLLMGSMVVILGTALVYLVKPSITPDHIWASRRFVPVVMPGLMVFGVYALSWASNTFRKKWAKVLIIGVSLLALTGPVLTSYPFWQVRTITRFVQLQEFCQTLPERSAVVWLGLARLEAVQPTTTFCNVPAVGFHKRTQAEPDKPTKETLQEIANRLTQQGFVPIVAAYGSQAGLIDKAGKKFTEASRASWVEIEQTLQTRPQKTITRDESLVLARIHADGTLQPIAN